MSREFWIRLVRNGVELDAVAPAGTQAAEVAQLPGAASSASVSLDPTEGSAVPVSPGDAWTILLVNTTPAGLETTEVLMSGATVRSSSYHEKFEPPQQNSPGVLTQIRTAALVDKHAEFRDRAPGILTRRIGTDSDTELRFVAGKLGFANVLGSPAAVAIGEIIYTREGGFWAPLAPYLAPWGLVDYVDPDSGVLLLLDTSELSADAQVSDRPLTSDDYNDFQATVDERIRVDQVKVNYLDTTGGDGVSPTPSDIVTDTHLHVEDDGSITTDFKKTGWLHENPDDPTERTRSVDIGEGMSRTTADGQALVETETTHTYEADYTRRIKTETVTSQLVDLPGVGETYREVERVTAKREYAADPDDARRKVLVRETKTTSGTYLYVDTGDFEADVLTATMASRAAHARTADTSSVSSQRWGEGRVRTWVERYERGPAPGVAFVIGTETDDLRNRVVDTWDREEPRDLTAANQGRPRFFYVPDPGVDGRTATEIDATRIGPALGRELAERLIARTAPIVRATLTLCRPDATQYRLGRLVVLDSSTPRGLAGTYLIVEAHWRATVPKVGDTTPAVVQTLTIYKAW